MAEEKILTQDGLELYHSNVENNHLNNQENPHNVTKSQVGLGNVENKSSAQIRNEITENNISQALGYKPSSHNVIMSSTQPSGQSIGDEWYEEVT